MSAIEVAGLDVRLGGRTVLQGVDLEVRTGELLGLLGPNGAGKTTLLRSMLGLLPPASGAVRVEGRPARTARRGVGYVPQRHEFAWDFPISVEEVAISGRTRELGWLRRPRAHHWRLTRAALERVGMADLARRPIGELSGGQRQRVLVARALVLEPRVLLLDEPFTGLDMPTQELLGRLFADLAHEGRAVVMTTHDLVAALSTCDRLALLNRRLIAVDAPARLRDDPAAWQQTFSVGPESPLMRVLAVI